MISVQEIDDYRGRCRYGRPPAERFPDWDADDEFHYRCLCRFATLPVANFPTIEEDGSGEPRPGGAEQAWSLWLNGHYISGEEGFDDYFERFLDLVDTEHVRELVIRTWGTPDDSSEETIRLLVENADRLPRLRLLALGDIPSEEAEISWIRQSDLTPLLEAYPRLEVLEVRGSDGLSLRPVRHESLRALRVECGGLPAHVVRAAGECDLPALEHLELWLGTPDYGGDATVADLADILAGERLPSLRYLGLRDSEIQDEVAAAVAAAPVVARLEQLDLSLGVLTDRGAEALLSGRPLTHLKKLDLYHHYLSDAGMARITAALPGVEVDVSGQEEPEEYDGEIWRYVAVSE